MLTGWIHDFFADVARTALNGVLGMLADSLLATPQFDQLPVMGQLWGSSRTIMIAAYALITTIAGIVAMAYHTVQTRSSLKEILPRLVVGFVAANLSLFLGGKAIEFANALSRAFLGDQTGMDEASRVFVETLLGKAPGDDSTAYGELYVVFTMLALVVMIIAVLLTYVVRIALTVILLASAPLVLMCHALPQTESLALWWWKAFGAVLAVQVAQSLTFIAALKIFYLPGGITLF
ncbi:hypothetical protein MOQ72_21670 [Saccharopolyspora sp. K220]|uniref:hypothetical protein n=1 Tax=Saccharopolyspora soli TaxID=2926618 RepID=UPI001F57CB5F|nr:hypothetical protein [Saccharopolyspora soli]MCI2420054.1 hypothetical protein [Saccharopolyspora soli]